jgi:hypothetical protein
MDGYCDGIQEDHMSRARIIGWARSAYSGDNRHDADTVVEVDCPDGVSVVEFARRVDAGEIDVVDPATGLRIRPGHGLTVVYASGRRREVRA